MARSSSFLTDEYENEIRRLIEKHLKLTKHSAYKLSRDALGWQDGVLRFMDGEDIKFSSLRKLETYIRTYVPQPKKRRRVTNGTSIQERDAAV